MPEPLEIDTEIRTDEATLVEAVSETISTLNGADNPAILAGIEPHRLEAKVALGEVIDRSG